ncbi:hypothetical protein AQI95_28975 [Streptomyces yokosukanensis]|uniref:Uncharacterized protein n=1 Tax=Streptomyces yokosukanensis TaxID=67386 RepID=A0A117Q0N5_9ACTN|nr:hypothetical protein [Streptomyces yokosukanensis]KUN02111.1 hypothetical protein AQI95_28975 [Streptomyces yokosukanensis]
MFDRIRRRRAAEPSEIQRRHFEMWAQLEGQVPPEVERMQAAIQPAAVVDDFLPPELRIPSHDQLDGRMMPWSWPIVLDDDVVACAECGAYRDWIILSTHDQILLRCRAGHQQHETRLDTAWYNRHAGPADSTHATFEDCLRHLGH